MSDTLPTGWADAILQEICDVNPRHPQNTDREQMVSFVPMPAVSDVLGVIEDHETRPLNEVWKGYTHFQDGDVIFAKITPCMENGKIAVASNLQNGLACGSTEFHVLRPYDGISAPLLWYFLRQKSFRMEAERSMTGAVGQRRVPAQYLQETVFRVPPVSEQCRIVAKLEALFARTRQAREELENILTLIEHYKQSILAAAFRGEVVPQNLDNESASLMLERILEERRARWEAEQLARYEERGQKPPKNWKDKYQEPELPDTSDLPELPEGWIWAAIGQVFEVYVGSTPSRKESEYWDGDIPWVSSGEVAFCRIKTTRECITQLGLDNASTTIHPVGTVLLGMIGEGKTRGQAAILDIPACHNQNSAAIRVSESGLPAEFLYYFLKGTYEETRRKGAGNNQPALNKTRVEAMIFPLPPLNEQREIVQRIDEAFEWLDTVLDEATSAMRLFDHLEQATLAKAFRGELVPQDPNDEPASVLLERIREARAEQTNGSQRKKRK